MPFYILVGSSSLKYRNYTYAGKLFNNRINTALAYLYWAARYNVVIRQNANNVNNKQKKQHNYVQCEQLTNQTSSFVNNLK
jgi:hypothetical protein